MSNLWKENNMKEIQYHRMVGKNHCLEVNAFYVYPQMQSIPVGFRLAIGRRGFFLSLSLLVLDLDLDIRWSGDHSFGFDIILCCPWFQILDFEFYNIHHKEK